MQGWNGPSDSFTSWSEATVHWRDHGPRPIVSFVTASCNSECNSEGDADDGETTRLPDLKVYQDAVLDSAGGPLPATLQEAKRSYIVAEKHDTLEKIQYRLWAWANYPNSHDRSPSGAEFQWRAHDRYAWRAGIVRLNPTLAEIGKGLIAEGIRIELATTPP